MEKERGHHNVLSESFLHLPLWPIFRQLHPNFITVRTAYASEIWAQLTKNLLTKSGTERFRENILPFTGKCVIVPSLTVKFIKTPLKALFYLGFSAVPFRFTI